MGAEGMAFLLGLAIIAGVTHSAGAQPAATGKKKRASFRVSIESIPSGATIYIDDEAYGELGVTPWTGRLPKGEWTVRLEKEGYEDTEATLTVQRSIQVQSSSFSLEESPPPEVVPIVVEKETSGVPPATNATLKSPLIDRGAWPSSPPGRAHENVSITSRPGDGLLFNSGDSLSLQVAGALQFRVGVSSYQAESSDYSMGFKRARILFAGHAYKPCVRYLMFLELLNVGLIDTFLQFKCHRDLQLRVGQFLVPFGRMLQAPAFHSDFNGRNIEEFNLGLDTGIELSSGDLLGLGKLGYNVFVGTGDGREGKNTGGFLYVARVFVSPLPGIRDLIEPDLQRSSNLRVTLGVSVAWNQDSPRALGNRGEAFTLGTMDYRFLGADLAMKKSGVSLIVEAHHRTAADPVLEGMGPDGALTEVAREATGLSTRASYFAPHNVEYVLRYGYLQSLSDMPVTDDRPHEIGVAAYAYLNDSMYALFPMKTSLTYTSRTNTGFDNPDHDLIFQLQGGF